MVKKIIGRDVYGHINNYLVQIVKGNILNVILKGRMEENIGFMDI